MNKYNPNCVDFFLLFFMWPTISAAHTNKHKNESNSFNGYLLAFSRFFIFVLIVCFGLFWFYPFG